MEILLRLGFLIDFISVPVIAGFTSAAAITIASSQVLMIKMALNVILAEVVVVVVVVLVMLLTVLVNIMVLSVAITLTKVAMTKTEQPGEGLAGGGDRAQEPSPPRRGQLLDRRVHLYSHIQVSQCHHHHHQHQHQQHAYPSHAQHQLHHHQLLD